MLTGLIPNEALFIVHSVIVTLFVLWALTRGKEMLIATICVFGILSNLFIIKQISLFGLYVVSTDVFAIGSIIGITMLQEFFGTQAVKTAIQIEISMLLFYLFASNMQLWYLPAPVDYTQEHFAAILSPSTRIIIASLCVYALTQMLAAYLFRLFARLGDKKHATIHHLSSLAISQLFDTILFSIAGLWGTVHSILPIIVVSYCIKMLVIICSSPFISLSRLLIEKPSVKP